MRQRIFSPHVAWTDRECRVLNTCYSSRPWGVLQKLLPNRSRAQITGKANSLSLTRKKPGRTLDEIRKAKREHMRKERKKRPEYCRKRQKKWREANRDRNLAYMRQYQSRRFFWFKSTRLRGTNRATAGDLSRLWHRQKGRCALSGKRLDRSAHLDHVVARAKGGSDEIGNLCWLHPEVNLAKRDLGVLEFRVLCLAISSWSPNSHL